MEALLLGIYSFFVWLIFFKFKWLPWNATSQVIVITLPIIGITALILTLNVVAPSSSDVRVLKYVINIVPQVRGRVIEVPVEPNRLVKKGEVLFKIDPTPYETSGTGARSRARKCARGTTNKTREDLDAAVARTRSVAVNLELAKTRVGQNAELVRAGCGRPVRARVRADRREASGSGSLRHRERTSRRSARNSTRKSATIRRKWRRCARNSRRRNGNSARPRCTRRPTVTRSTWRCGPAR